MSVLVRQATPEDLPGMISNDFRAFGVPPAQNEKGLDQAERYLDLDRFFVGEDRGDIVANSGAFSLDLTLPGGTQLPVSGVTWVAVGATHRRQGLLRTMMAEMERDARDRDEVAMALFASEGGIYANVGFGAATQIRAVSIATDRAVFRTSVDPSAGSLRHLDAAEAAQVLPELHERLATASVGEVTRGEVWWQGQLFDAREPVPHVVVFSDASDQITGSLCYRQTAEWHNGHPHHQVEVVDARIGDRAAHHALWSFICSLDLVGTVTTMHLPLDDPLPTLLVDPRAVRTTELIDGLWIRLLDVERWFSTRSYGAAGDVVIDVEGGGDGVAGRWRITSGTDETGSCRSDADAADVALTAIDLGAVSLGGTSVIQLERGGRVEERRPGAVAELAAMLRRDPLPFCATEF